MIYKVYPSLNDFENLSRLKVETSEFANNFDYKDIIVNKPWGYEYLWYQNEKVAIWFLYIKKGQSTSLHCHAKKRTSLIVLDGIIQCRTLDDKYQLNTLESVVLEPCVFHASMALSEEGVFLMEIETPPMKGDLVRMQDAYGRQNSGYEKTNEYSKDFHLYDYYPFNDVNSNSWKFRKTKIRLTEQISAITVGATMVVPIKTTVKTQEKKRIEIGETVLLSTLNLNNDSIIGDNHHFLVFSQE